MKAIFQFDLLRNEDEFIPMVNSIFIHGVISMYMLDYIFEQSTLSEIGEHLKNGERKTITLKVWEDSGDYRYWLEYEVLPDDYEINFTLIGDE
jgi:hypothetical protein